ncbi:MAG: PEP-CTERM sorting domain-containing protein [Sphingomonadales bacterium]
MIAKFKALMVAGAISAAMVVPAAAATIDFSGVQGSNTSPLVLPEATLTNLTGTTVLVGPSAANQTDGFCFISFGCAADGEISFSTAVMNLSFDVDGWDSSDFVEISAFNGGSLLGSLDATADGNLDFSAFGTITRLFFDDNSTGAGVGYSTFLFDLADTQAIPAPGALGLLGLGLVGLGLARRRKAA